MATMDSLITKLEAWRAAHGLSKSDMARLIGAKQSQDYTNWIARDSLPKKYYTATTAILGSSSPEKAKAQVRSLSRGIPVIATMPSGDQDITALLSQLGETAKIEAYGAICRQLSPKDALRLAQILLQQVAGEI